MQRQFYSEIVSLLVLRYVFFCKFISLFKMIGWEI